MFIILRCGRARRAGHNHFCVQSCGQMGMRRMNGAELNEKQKKNGKKTVSFVGEKVANTIRPPIAIEYLHAACLFDSASSTCTVAGASRRAGRRGWARPVNRKKSFLLL